MVDIMESIGVAKEGAWVPSRPGGVVTICPYCAVGCQLRLDVKNGRVIRVSPDFNSPANNGLYCVKGKFSIVDFVHHPDRLTTPLIKKGDSFVPAPWEEALHLVAEKFAQYKGSFGALASAKGTNEENYLFQKFLRGVMGTNNLDFCTRLCHSSSVAAMLMALGSEVGTCTNEDIDLAEVLMVAGDNTTETQPVNGERVQKAARRGAALIVIDPREIELTRWARLHLKLRPGTDVALINGMISVILQENLGNKEFVAKRTEGFAEAMEVAKKYPLERAQEISGVPADKIREAARLYATHRSLLMWGMGISQHVHGVNNALALCNLAFLCGQVGRVGTGLYPLRGQNNVSGVSDMGCLPMFLPGFQSLDDVAVVARFEKAWGRPIPREKGLTVVEMSEAILTGKIKAMYIMGENPLLTDPNLRHAEQAFRKLEFLVVQDIFLTETARLAQVVLPGASFAEKEGTFTNSDRRVQRVRKAVEPQGQARADGDILRDLSSRMGYPLPYTSAEEVFREAASLIPEYAGITYERLGVKGLQWPCPTPTHPGTKRLHVTRFRRGLGKFHPVEYLPCAEEVDAQYPLRLTTGRLREHFHSATMTRRSPGLNILKPEAFVEINPADATWHGISEGDMVKVASRRGEIKVKAKVTGRVNPGVVFIPFHFAEAAANVLTIDALDPVSKIPEFKSCAARLEKLR